MKYHANIDIEDFLSTARFPQSFDRMLRHPNGKPMSAKDVQSEMFAQLKQGNTYMQAGSCDNFSPVHGCMGHPEDPPAAPAASERSLP